MKGASGDLQKALYDLQPYKGGDDEDIWALDFLNNADKHRVLIALAGGFHYWNTRSEDWSREHLVTTHGERWVSQYYGKVRIQVATVPDDFKTFPLETGDVLRTFPVGAYNEARQPDFPVSIVLGEPDILREKETIFTLTRLADSVENTLKRLVPLV